MPDRFHSVTLDESRCKGCINCIKRCPTEAIRVRNGKAHILSERCIDCGECIRVCPHHAKMPIYDPLSSMDNFSYKIALPAPALYGQFHNLDDIDVILNGLLKMGFDEVFEVSRAAEVISDATRKLEAEHKLIKPIISSACPAVVRLIQIRFPMLLDHLLPLNPPVEVAAALARKEAVKKTGRKPEEIGVFFLSPCAAKNSAVKQPLGLERSNIDHVLAIKDVYPPLLAGMKKAAGEDMEELGESGRIGISWASSGGEASGTLIEDCLAADGIENVIHVLENLEDEKFQGLEFVELNACNGGCVGGVLTVENPYIALARLKHLRKYLPVSACHLDRIPDEAVRDHAIKEEESVLSLSTDFAEAMQKMAQMEEIVKRLPGLDCGSCGAPSCHALAEDIVRGHASERDCVFLLRQQMSELAEKLSQFDDYIPLPIRSDDKEESE